MTAYYNEIDPTAAHVLRHLISAGVIAPGDVDTRSIKDVKPDDLRGYTQCHFFAGGGLWSVAARLAGWPDDRPLWTGSCPCQPFSQAGQGRGIADERHLWPDFHRLIAAVRPPVVVGEQVAGKAGYGWLDGVRADLGKEGYASGAVDIPAAAVDAPHIRQRLYWVAVADAGYVNGQSGPGEQGDRQEPANLHGLLSDAFGRKHPRSGTQPDQWPISGEICAVPSGVMADTPEQGLPDWFGGSMGRPGAQPEPERFDERLEHPAGERRGEGWPEPEFRGGRATTTGADASSLSCDAGSIGCTQTQRSAGNRDEADSQKPANSFERPYRANGSFWSDHEWLHCHDNKARRTKPGLRLLVDGYAGRVGMWRIAGNAIVAPLAAEVLKTLCETLDS